MGDMLAALLLALVAVPQESTPLLEAPAGWTTERIPFPLDFAPELAYRGVEDLAFAPEMFKKGAGGYFSYALALELEGEHEIDARFLENFFTTYYRGLCRAVGEPKGLALELERVSAKAECGPDYATVTVEAFDPFTDGGALTLTLEVRMHARAGKTELAALASPAEKSARIWKELRPMLQAWMRARPAPLFLNHVFWVVDRAAYEALKAEPFLRELAVFEERTTVRGDLSYTGLYLYGRHTYLEFLAEDAAAGFTAGQSGLALGLERAGGTDALAIELHKAGLPSEVMPVTRAEGTEQIAWFNLLGLELPPGPLQVFTMEYNTRFLGKWRPDLPATPPSTARAAILARYAEALGQDASKVLLRDVTSVALTLDEAQKKRLVTALSLRGYGERADPDSDKSAFSLEGPGVRLAITPGTAPGGLTGCELTLAREVTRAPLELGQVRLRFEGTRAVLELAR
jgi:hypothetical protein